MIKNKKNFTWPPRHSLCHVSATAWLYSSRVDSSFCFSNLQVSQLSGRVHPFAPRLTTGYQQHFQLLSLPTPGSYCRSNLAGESGQREQYMIKYMKWLKREQLALCNTLARTMQVGNHHRQDMFWVGTTFSLFSATCQKRQEKGKRDFNATKI